jgi:hypothetical protein
MTAMPHVDIFDVIFDDNLFGRWFKKRATWLPWYAFLAALFALPMTAEQLAIYQQCTGRSEAPTKPASEAWLICGRRAGKSFIIALCATFMAVFRTWTEFLAPGERGTILIVACDRKQARIVFRYIKALLAIPLIKPMIVRQTDGEYNSSIDLDNEITIEVHVSSFRSVRGYAIICAILDEAAYFPTDEAAADPDVELVNAVRPGMLQFPNALLLVASSPYAKRGELWNAFQKHYGRDGDAVLVWKAATRTMNPTMSQAKIDAEYEEDPVKAAAEYGAEFRSDIESFISREAVLACVPSGIRERPRAPGMRYRAFVDPSGGSSDSMTLAIGHTENGIAMLDCIRERRPPFSPEAVCTEFAAVLKSYGVNTIQGDRYAGEWVASAFAKLFIKMEYAKPKSEIYGDVLPIINSRRCDLLDHPKMIAQFCGLERSTARSGKDSIDHAPGGHDDIANAVAGVIVALATKSNFSDLSWVDGSKPGDTEADRNAAWRRSMLAAYCGAGVNGRPPPMVE